MTETSESGANPFKLSNQIPEKLGEIQVIYGPMFSGKSTELLRRIRRYRVRGDLCLVLKTKDSHFQEDEKIVTHDEFNSFEAVSCDALFDVLELVKGFDVVGVDEGQFFKDIISFAELIANLGKIVIVACLDSDFRREPFGNTCELIAKAEKVTKLNSICHYCKDDAAFSARITTEKAIKVIGGRDKYRPVCRSCYSALLEM
jgi:thymidine kinase